MDMACLVCTHRYLGGNSSVAPETDKPANTAQGVLILDNNKQRSVQSALYP